MESMARLSAAAARSHERLISSVAAPAPSVPQKKVSASSDKDTLLKKAFSDVTAAPHAVPTGGTTCELPVPSVPQVNGPTNVESHPVSIALRCSTCCAQLDFPTPRKVVAAAFVVTGTATHWSLPCAVVVIVEVAVDVADSVALELAVDERLTEAVVEPVDETVPVPVEVPDELADDRAELVPELVPVDDAELVADDVAVLEMLELPVDVCDVFSQLMNVPS